MKFISVARILILLAFMALPGLGKAQETTWIIQGDRGWIGVTVDYTAALVGNTWQTVATVENVEEGSPAQTAGIQPGDVISRLGGKQVSQKTFTSLIQTLKPGDRLPITLMREGRIRDVMVEAGHWPDRERVIISPEYGEIVIRMDTIQKAILDELDQMRLRIGELHLDSAPAHLSLSVVRRPPTEGEEGMTVTYMFEPRLDNLAFFGRDFVFEPDFPMPFEAMVVRSEAIQRVQNDQMRVRGALNDVRRLEAARRNELRASSPRLTAEELERDERVRELRAKQDELMEEQEVLTRRLKQISEEELGRRVAEMHAQQEAAFDQVRAAREQNQVLFEEDLRAAEAAEGAFTYSRLVAAGQNLVAGAELEPLNPKLAQYFRVDGGVLVLDVLENTPAAEADLQGGDVIVMVAGDSVSSVEELKFGLGYLGRPLRLMVIRNGEPLEIFIRK